MTSESLIQKLKDASYHKPGSNTRGLDLDAVVALIKNYSASLSPAQSDEAQIASMSLHAAPVNARDGSVPSKVSSHFMDVCILLSHITVADSILEAREKAQKAYDQMHYLRPPEPVFKDDISDSSEFEIARLAKQMEAEYIERFGTEAIQPDFIASAKDKLSNKPHSLTGLTEEELTVAINAVIGIRRMHNVSEDGASHDGR